MKKIYEIPTITVVNIQTAQMIANSSLETSETPADPEGGMLSRRSTFSIWGDDDE